MGQNALMVLFSESDIRKQPPHHYCYLAVKFYCVALHRTVPLGQVYPSWLQKEVVVISLQSRW